MDSFHMEDVNLSQPSTSSAPSPVQYLPTPPPLHIISENIIPSLLGKTHLTKGLQHQSPLVQHLSALTLIKSLQKFEQVTKLFGDIAQSLEEDQDGQWTSRLKAVQQDIWKRLPDYRLVVTFSQQSKQLIASPTETAKASTAKKVTERNHDTVDLLSDAALRLMWLYSNCVPYAVAEVRFDSGKLLGDMGGLLQSDDVGSSGGVESTNFKKLRLLHALRLVRTDPQFLWSSKQGKIKLNLASDF
jgi:nucleolar pre-ribosomal-associated protein 1